MITDDGASIYAHYKGLLELNEKVAEAVANGSSTDFGDQYFPHHTSLGDGRRALRVAQSEPLRWGGLAPPRRCRVQGAPRHLTGMIGNRFGIRASPRKGVTMNARAFGAVTLVPGAASGPVLRLDEPLSFWGGLDAATGTIVDRLHPQRGKNVAGRILMMPAGRGSSSGSATLAEALRLGKGP